MLGTRLHSLSAAVAAVLISIHWPLISSLRLLRAPALPEPSLFTPYSLSHTPDVLLLNGGALDSTQQLGSQPAAGHPAAAAAAVLAPPPPPEPPPFNSSSTNSSNGSFMAHNATYQPTGISRDGMFIMILIFMLMITIPVGIALDGPMRVLLNAAKPYSNRFSEGFVSCVSTVWNTFLAYCAVAVVSAIAAVHCAVLAANAVIVAPTGSAAARLRTAAAAAVCCCLSAMGKSSSCCCKQHVQQEADIQALPTVTAASSQSTTAAAAAAAGAVTKNINKGCNPEIHNSHIKDAVNVVGENQSLDNVVVQMGQVSNTTNNNSSSSSSSCCHDASGSDSSSCPECKDTQKQQLEQSPDQQQTDGDKHKTSTASDRVASLAAAAAAAPEGVSDDDCEVVHDDDQRIARD